LKYRISFKFAIFGIKSGGGYPSNPLICICSDFYLIKHTKDYLKLHNIFFSYFIFLIILNCKTHIFHGPDTFKISYLKL